MDAGQSPVAEAEDQDREAQARAAAEQAMAAAQAGQAPQASDEDRAAARRVAAALPHEREDVTVVGDEHREAMDNVADGRASEDEVALATEWLLSDEHEVNTRRLRIRIGGSDDDPQYGGWVIRAIGVDVIRSAEREASGNRQSRRSGEGYDELKANLRIVAAGTVEPDLGAAARDKGMADPTSLLRKRFQFRSGLIAQLAGEIMSLSGFDAEDVKAAGN